MQAYPGDRRFKVGDKVVSHTDSQGLQEGKVYEVTDLTVRRTAFGEFVTYEVDSSDGEPVHVRNAHLVLALVEK